MRLCDKKDALWLTALMLDSEIYGGCSEDGTEKHKMASYVKNMLARPDLVVLSPVPGKMIHTFHTFIRHTGVMWEIHTAIRRDCGIPGRERVQLTREACAWMIKNRGARKFITHVPEGNRAAGLYAAQCGMVRVGVLTSAMKKDGVLIDMALYQSQDADIKNVLGGM